MSSNVSKILIDILAAHGPELAHQARRLRGLLLDRCPTFRREIAALVFAVESRAAKEPRIDNGKTSPSLLLPRLAERLYDEYGTDRVLARWAMESWAEALRLAQIRAAPKSRTAPRTDSASRTDSVSPDSKKIFTVKGVTFRMVRIPAGEFMMGSPPDEPERANDETQHLVRITRDYWLGETQVTQGLWMAVMGVNPSHFKKCGPNCPVESVSWDDCQIFIQRLKQHIQGGGFRLPAEAEWEYACRAGTTTPFHTGRCLDTDEANYDGNAPMKGCQEGEYRNKTIKVASFAPNAWGLYDMHGNVWEWCQDWYGKYPYGTATDPDGSTQGASRVRRGGSWNNSARYCRSASRDYTPVSHDYNLGLRLARSFSPFTAPGTRQ